MEVAEHRGYALPKDAAVRELWWLGGRMSVKAGGDQTAGRLAQLVFSDPKGKASPLHVHDEAWESFYVIDGELTLFIGDDRIEATAGDYGLVPPGVSHAYLVRSDGTRFLATIAPAGTEAFFAELGVPVAPGDTQAPAVALDPEEFARRARPHGIEIVGPPPTLD